ncbi:MAG: putative repeat protein (TIGR04138 family) [Pirellulaceae bacterium]|jgi:uncharacterized repeat protein (TIGR04138 family)
MNMERHPIFKLLESDPRYKIDAYQFVREALSYAQEVLQMGGGLSGDGEMMDEDFIEEMGVEDLETDDPYGSELASNELASNDFDPDALDSEFDEVQFEEADDVSEQSESHLTGQQLCEAIRIYAVEQFGYMAQTVLGSWGLRSTSDFGDIVYNLISVELMKKSDSDRREDFNDVYDFEEVFKQRFKITMPD